MYSDTVGTAGSLRLPICQLFFFFNDTATTEIYTLSLHDALPISRSQGSWCSASRSECPSCRASRSEEHTSELQSRGHLVCRLLLEKKKQITEDNPWCTYKKYRKDQITVVHIYNITFLSRS